MLELFHLNPSVARVSAVSNYQASQASEVEEEEQQLELELEHRSNARVTVASSYLALPVEVVGRAPPLQELVLSAQLASEEVAAPLQEQGQPRHSEDERNPSVWEVVLVQAGAQGLVAVCHYQHLKPNFAGLFSLAEAVVQTHCSSYLQHHHHSHSYSQNR